MWNRSASNRQPPGCKPGALPLLSYGPVCARRESNPDLRLVVPVLDRSSSTRMCRPLESNQDVPLFRRLPGPPRPGRRTPLRSVRGSNPSQALDRGSATQSRHEALFAPEARCPRQESNLPDARLEGERLSDRPRGHCLSVPGRTRTCIDRFRKPAPRPFGHEDIRAEARGDVRGSHPPPLIHSQSSSLDE